LQIFISFFFKQPKKKKVVKVAAGAVPQYAQSRDIPLDVVHFEKEVVLEEGEAELLGEENLAIEEEAIDMAAMELEDDGHGVHDDLVVGSLCGTAIQMMAEQEVVIEKDEETMALQNFPRVSIQ
jgi:hypothetical protein